MSRAPVEPTAAQLRALEELRQLYGVGGHDREPDGTLTVRLLCAPWRVTVYRNGVVSA